MKWCRFEHNKEIYFGIFEDPFITKVIGTPFGNFELSDERYKLEDVKLDIPVLPSTFYAVGVNYINHVKKMAKIRGIEGITPKSPDVGYRANNALIPHNETIIIPKDASENIQYEGELVVVIGKVAKNLDKNNVWDHIFGYTIGNDVSERNWQSNDRTLWRAKNTDSFKPMGPYIETDIDLNSLRTIIRINNEIKDDFKTNDMIFGISDYLCKMTKYLTLYPGDVIWMGTDEVPQNIKDGDIVEIEITGIGTLINPVIKE
ncbi:MAG: DUF2437 domain-containing protein [SAR202 cluster bacterium]|nr:DUF2437 domain-containing protein [SAR202 cluster bacterium]MQF93412.1 DUF2437 domain-containing protein [SAR202 cluster bacterium]|tara:strand:- start:1584 stop:2363 length:780 start_codon:yes stop_codon:yes gene_type:complete